jgi:broad specificity phosphatase PhoE
MLVLVRHAMVTFHREVPSAQWHLSPDGRAAAEALAARDTWAPLVRVYSSHEPKAIATAQRCCAANALPLTIEPALHEVERPWSEGDYKSEAESYLRGQARDGWEPRGAATERMRGAVEGVLSAHTGGDVAVVSHGLVLSLYLASLLDLDPEATAALWRGIGFPDYAVVDPAARTLVQPFGWKPG